MAALYRKYRPQNFAQVVGQKAIVQTLKNAVELGTVAHAYLFCGGRGVGKTSLARILAKAVNCEHPKKGEACLKCKSCLNALGSVSMDLVEIDAASNTGVENIRELIDHARFKPSGSKFKIFIIDEVHMLSRGAFNALLKTLEEPPEHVIFILATTEIHKVPATIISRTQRFDFGQLSQDDIAGALENILEQEKFKLNSEAVRLIAERAEGSMRDALSILDKVFTLGQKPEFSDVQKLLGSSDTFDSINLLNLIIGQDAKGLVHNFDSLLSKGVDFLIFNKDFLEYLRKILVFKLSGEAEGFGLSSENFKVLAEQAEKISVGELMRIIRLFLRSFKELADSPSPELPMLLSSLEVFFKPGINTNQESRITNYEANKANQEIAEKITKADDLNSKFVIPDSQPQTVSASTAEIVSEDTEPVNIIKITDHWPEILAEIKKTNSPLASLLKGASILDTHSDRLIFGVKYMFDKESLENLKNAGIVKQAIEKICGQRVGVGAKIVKKETPGVLDAGLALADALTVFGGELVE